MKIVVGYLTTPEGEAALEAAIAEARLRDAELVVIHSMRGGARDEARDALASADALEKVRARLDEQGVRHDIHEFVRGNPPAEDLLEVCDREDVGLLVIGIRRRSPVGKLVLGSNAQDIILKANCPVLAVKAD